MPKPLLTRPETRNLTGTTLSTAPIQQQKLQTQQMNKMELDRYLRKKRSKDYIQTMCELDIGGHVQNQQKVKRIIDAIHNEFPEVEINGIMLGIVSICYLGKPYEVHTLDVTGQIIEHYPGGKALPGGPFSGNGCIPLVSDYDFHNGFLGNRFRLHSMLPDK